MSSGRQAAVLLLHSLVLLTVSSGELFSLFSACINILKCRIKLQNSSKTLLCKTPSNKIEKVVNESAEDLFKFPLFYVQFSLLSG